MPKLRTPDNTARKYLFSGQKVALASNTGISRSTLYRRYKRPGDTTLDELAALVVAQELQPDEVYKILMERG